MKRFIIFFLIVVSIMTFSLTRSKEVDETNIVTTDEIEQYKQSLLNTYKKYGYTISETELNKNVQKYIDTQTSIAKSKASGMEFKQALKISLIVSSIFFILLFFLFHLKTAQYNEIFGNSFCDTETNTPLNKIRHFFFGRWF